jgi:hypothetical protein
MPGCKQPPFELPVLTAEKAAALRVSKINHFRLGLS